MVSAKWCGWRRLISRRVGALVVICMIMTASMFASAGSASAWDGKCHGPFWSQNYDICVRIVAGQKDQLSHSEFISWVAGDQISPAPDHFMEVWGDGFYYSWYGVYREYNINRWVRSGTNICARETDDENRSETACFHIQV